MKAFWLDQSQSLSSEALRDEGVYTAYLPLSDAVARDAGLARVCHDFGYKQRDEVQMNAESPDFDVMSRLFLREHAHAEDEVRYVLAGEGVFDIRSRTDRWMRVEVKSGDLLIVPQGRHHRFMLSDARHIHCLRLFKDSEGWTPIFRQSAASASEES
ncbi:MAG: 1,2-dihydroxy-3-keto-5-methylthiopentene dioxygenase [Polyangiales bacterium]